MADINALRAPFALHEHQWRPQGVTKDGKRAQALCYIDARAVQNRLDEVCGIAGWESSYEETRGGRVIATIAIDVGGRWVSKADGAGATAKEGEKGGISDAFKRAGVAWGVGRYLYSLPSIWADCNVATNRDGSLKLYRDKPTFRGWTREGQMQLDAALNALINNVFGFQYAVENASVPALPAPAAQGAALESDDEIANALVADLMQAFRHGDPRGWWEANRCRIPVAKRNYLIAVKDRCTKEQFDRELKA